MRHTRLYSMLFAGLALTSLAAAEASAQEAVSPLQGPLVPGVCLLSRQAVFEHAKVGEAATARLKQLAGSEQTRLASTGRPLQADIQSFRAEADKLKPADRDAREKTLNQRLQSFEAARKQSSEDLEATQRYALNKISQLAQPAVAASFKAKQCGLLLDRNAVLGGNMGNDLTADVVKRLDAQTPTISFELQHAAQAPAQSPSSH